MTPLRKILIAVVLTTLALSAGAGWAVFASGPQRPEYPDAPFNPVAKDSPRILPVAEWPVGKDKGTTDRFRAERERVRKYLREDGAVRRVSAIEREAFHAMLEAIEKDRDGFVKARELAGKALDADPRSAVAHYVMAEVEHYGEANLPRALFEIRQARRLLEALGAANPNDADARQWYLLVLHEEQSILHSMDRREEQLRVIDLIEQVYGPTPWLRLFALIKLERLEEVEHLLEALDREGNWPLRVLNTRIMLAERRRDRAGGYRAGKNTVDKIAGSAVLWHNFGGACLNDFRIDEAEAAFLKSVRVSNDFYGSSYFPLSAVYLQGGRVQEAWQAVKKGQAERAARKPHTLQQDQTTADRAAALVLLALGKGEEAERFARRAFERPGRVGSKTDNERDDHFANGFLLWLALETRIAQFDATTPASVWQRESLRAESWALRQKLTKLLGDAEFLIGLLRTNLPGQAAVETWQLGSVLALIPAGVAEEALAHARQSEQHPAAIPYFDALAAELAFSRGQYEKALAKAQEALAKLPAAGEKLLRARVAAIGAESARRLGQTEIARPLTLQALRDFPQVFRILGLRLPVRVEDDGSPLARRVSTTLLASPRFRSDSDGFRIEVRADGARLVLSLYRTETEVHVQFEVPIGADVDAAMEAATSRFHERMASPALDLTTVEINAFEQTSRPQG